VSDGLSVVVPAYNEARRLPALLDALAGEGSGAFAAAGLELAEVIVVDDGSIDGTFELVRGRSGGAIPLRALRLERNRGKGAAVQAGMLAARERFALLTDADMATPLEDIARLAARVHDGADVAIGSRALPSSDILVHQPGHRELLGKGFNRALRLLTGLPYRDTQCGFKLFRLSTARRLFELQRVPGFAYDVELLVLARQLGLSVAEVGVRWADDRETTVKIFSASSRMALDLLRIAWLARVPAAARPERAPLARGPR
jgi:glycosyltransferase involved in cell wall biosynthesis